MKQYLKQDEWCIIEEGFHREFNKISESVFSIGNGRMGQRANFEEKFTGKTLQGSYVAGVYYPDKTRVGWWKNGYPEYFAKVLNAANWIGIDISLEGQELDLNKCEVENFTRVLNMKEGYLERSFDAKMEDGHQIKVNAKRFCSIVDDQIGVIRYAIRSINFQGKITVSPYIDADVLNEDSNYDEKFWNEIFKEATEGQAIVTVETKKTGFHVTTGMRYDLVLNGKKVPPSAETLEKEKYAGNTVSLNIVKGDELIIYKYAANISSENHQKSKLIEVCKQELDKAQSKGFEQMLKQQSEAWAQKWEESDIVIEGDVSAQQGIRFNIFQLDQTYTGEDERLNIGPKGFTGEKYGGSTYWDTEAYCLPFYLSTSEQRVGRNLLIYRYKHLQKAIENAEILGFSDGAALYPMVTMNGEECHNEWEITFEEIHRNGAIAFAIYDYVNYTGDQEYLVDHGLEVLIGISRFWTQRVSFSEDKKKYVMLGVTGPNEFENNVHNNWYTLKLAEWTLNYVQEAIGLVKKANPDHYKSLAGKLNFNEPKEVEQWNHILDNIYLPEDKELGIFLQQDGYLDKELISVKDLDPKHLPIVQNWSWDRILRSCFIKQADVLQGIYLFEDQFDLDTIKRNYDFYEAKTVHESSLSPCVHSILAAKLGYRENAYEFYLRTARLDLDDYNNDTEDGCHITSMAGTWMSIVKGFGGMRVRKGNISFEPFIPEQWTSYSFNIRFRGAILNVKVSHEEVEIWNESTQEVNLAVHSTNLTLEANQKTSVKAPIPS